jgi:hypothetical protein
MPALVRALKRVDLPTLGKPTMPHLRLMEKVLINQDPSCTIKPNTGVVEVLDMRRYVVAKVQVVPSKNALDARWMSEFCPGVNALDCTYHRSPADAARERRHGRVTSAHKKPMRASQAHVGPTYQNEGEARSVRPGCTDRHKRWINGHHSKGGSPNGQNRPSTD